MKDTWNLDRIYRGFEDPAFGADMKALQEKAADYNAFAAGLEQMDAMAGLRQGILLEEELDNLARKLATYAQLRQSVNTRDSACGSYFGESACQAGDMGLIPGPGRSHMLWST